MRRIQLQSDMFYVILCTDSPTDSWKHWRSCFTVICKGFWSIFLLLVFINQVHQHCLVSNLLHQLLHHAIVKSQKSCSTHFFFCRVKGIGRQQLWGVQFRVAVTSFMPKNMMMEDRSKAFCCSCVSSTAKKKEVLATVLTSARNSGHWPATFSTKMLHLYYTELVKCYICITQNQ